MLFSSVVVALKYQVDVFYHLSIRFPTTGNFLTSFLSEYDNDFGFIVQPVILE